MEKNRISGQQYIITYFGIDDRAYLNMQFGLKLRGKKNNSTRAGYGFIILVQRRSVISGYRWLIEIRYIR